MDRSKNTSFADRLSAAAEAKKAQLERAARARSESESPAAVERRAAREAVRQHGKPPWKPSGRPHATPAMPPVKLGSEKADRSSVNRWTEDALAQLPRRNHP